MAQDVIRSEKSAPTKDADVYSSQGPAFLPLLGVGITANQPQVWRLMLKQCKRPCNASSHRCFVFTHGDAYQFANLRLL